MKKIMIFLITVLASPALFASGVILKGQVLSSDKSPVNDAVVSGTGAKTVRTGSDGFFKLDEIEKDGTVTIWASGYYMQTVPLKGQSDIVVYLIPESRNRYNETTLLPFRTETGVHSGVSANIAKKDFVPGSMSIDKALKGEVAGLKVTDKSGMTGEGAYMNLRGLRSLIADNAPLIVLNGIPYLPNKNESELIDGYARSVFQSFNINDIQNITVLKGAETSLYGSMGSNGVILIETDGASSNDLETKISYFGQVGINWNDKRIPLMNTKEYKSYLSDIGMTYYDNMETFFANFPFLEDPNNMYSYLYKNNTDWQNEIYGKGLVTDNLFRVEGGDAIAKYDISLGYMRDEGTLLNTSSSRYHTQINTNVMVSKKFEITASVALAYLNGKYQEQGMSVITNPVMAAYKKSPLLNPYKCDIDGNLLETYSNYYYGASKNMDFASSNPVAMVNILEAKNRQYDVNSKVEITYRPTESFTFRGNLGLFYNYDQESLFIPGVNNSEILPLYDQYGEAKNTVKVGVAETFNMYYGLNASYLKAFSQKHKIGINSGVQVLTTSNEFDAGSGKNTPNDFYQTLGDVNSIGRYFFGYNDVWNWMSYYAHADYTYADILKTSLNCSVDGSSSSGTDVPRLGTFPSAGITFMAKNCRFFRAIPEVNKLNIHAEYGLTGNSRFSSDYGKYYYTSKPYQGISGIIRANVPNTRLKWEKDKQLDVGVDASLFRNHFDFSFGYYNAQASDVIMISPKSSVYGTADYYSNNACISSHGFELSMQLNPLCIGKFSWIVGGNITTLDDKVKSLGVTDQSVITLSDKAQLVTRVGENPYSFYGYQTEGVFSTTAEANEANIKNVNGLSYKAGDIHYVDQDHDNVISDKDKVLIGSATPDLYGGFYTRFELDKFALDFNFIYSYGNDAYNAVRRSLESLSDFGNQSKAAVRRWTMEGQVTDVPRAEWGDAIGNNDFSDRWIEDASFVKLRDVTFSYTFDNPVFDFFQSGTIYVTGQNLITFTKYLGLDPEFSYSYSDALQGIDYAKMTLPKTIKFGVNLKF